YGAAAQSVARLMAERPGLRIAIGDGDEAITEFVAVRVFAESDQVDLIRAMRLGPGPLELPYAACLTGGLRRLPVLRGVVIPGGRGGCCWPKRASQGGWTGSGSDWPPLLPPEPRHRRDRPTPTTRRWARSTPPASPDCRGPCCEPTASEHRRRAPARLRAQ